MSAEYGPSRSPFDAPAAVAEREALEARAFAAWMAKVDALLVKRFGLDSSDLGDCCYRDWYEDGESPSGAAREALRVAREDGGL